MKLIVTVGVPASGKTTWAEQYCKENNAVNVNRDDLRQEFFGPFKWGEYKFTNKNEDLVTRASKERAVVALRQGRDVVVSDTNLKPEYRDVWKSIAHDNGAEYEELLFHITFKEAMARDKAREMSVGGQVMTRMFQAYHQHNRDLITSYFKERLELLWAIGTKTCVLSDIDGTVSEMHKGEEGRRSPYEWLRVGEDSPRTVVLDILKSIADTQGHDMIFVTGRDGVCYEHTYCWLTVHAWFKFYLFSRAKGDSRPDWVVKLELLEEIALKGYKKPIVMFDDRQQVVDVIRGVGIDVFQVAEGNF